jgi:hypothetical protein
MGAAYFLVMGATTTLVLLATVVWMIFIQVTGVTG